MAYELRNNSGSLFKNKKKTEDKYPSMTGEIMVEGVVYQISAWSRETNSGDKWLSLSVKVKEDNGNSRGGSGKTSSRYKDDMPF